VTLRHRQTLYSLLFPVGALVLVGLYVYFPPRSLGGVAAAFVFGPLWAAAFVCSLVLTWRETGWSGGILTHGVTFFVLLTLMTSMYAGGSGRQPVREIRAAIAAYRHPDDVVYSDLYRTELIQDEEWTEPRRAAALLKFSDSLPDAGCAVGYRHINPDGSSSRTLNRFYYIEWRDGVFTTSDSTVTINAISADTILVRDDFQGEDVILEIEVRHLVSQPTKAGPFLTLSQTEVPAGIRVESGCPRMWLEDGFSRHFYYYLKRQGWPWQKQIIPEKTT